MFEFVDLYLHDPFVFVCTTAVAIYVTGVIIAFRE